MRLRVEPATAGMRAALEALFQLYVYDFSAMVGEDVEEDGRFPAPQLDTLWNDPRQEPFLFRVEDRLAGLAIVHHGSRLTGEAEVWDMAQFFVMKKYRRQGLGARAARRLFEMHRGPWEVRQIPENTAATAFWRRVIDDVAGPGGWIETREVGDQWRGTVQRFTSAATAG
jgi:predicted acetyltransferase